VKRPSRISKPDDVAKIMAKRMETLEQEYFYTLLLNTKNELIASELISVGSLNATIVHPREILKPAILHSAANIIVTHNHPTGDPTPSSEDIEFTRRLAKCAELIGIGLLDHVVLGKDDFASLKEGGYF